MTGINYNGKYSMSAIIAMMKDLLADVTIAEKDKKDIIEKLLMNSSDADLKSKPGERPYVQRNETFEGALLVNQSGRRNLTLLIEIVKAGDCNIADWLIETHQANVDQADASGKTPLFYACEKGLYNIVEMLIKKHKADVNKSEYETPLDVAIKNEHQACANYLIGHGAKTSTENSQNLSKNSNSFLYRAAVVAGVAVLATAAVGMTMSKK